VVLNGHRNRAAIEGVAEDARSFGVRAIAVLADVGAPAADGSSIFQAGTASRSYPTGRTT
jgi:hypothetical protein